MTKSVNLFLVSDSSGETVLAVSRAALAQFENLKVEKKVWPLIRSIEQIDRIVSEISDKNYIVLYTVIDKKLRTYLKDECKKINVKCISAIAHVIKELSEHLEILPEVNIPGMQYLELDTSYFQRMDALDFTIQHDDGQNLETVCEGDIVLLGASRTSKTPTAFYLAGRGYKVANIPFIHGAKFPIDLQKLSMKKCFGLTISPQKLAQIRNNRISDLQEGLRCKTNEYIDIEAIANEIKEAKRIFAQLNINVIDVTNKAIEEVAAEIISQLEVA